jgi:hypothetical protein
MPCRITRKKIYYYNSDKDYHEIYVYGCGGFGYDASHVKRDDQSCQGW